MLSKIEKYIHEDVLDAMPCVYQKIYCKKTTVDNFNNETEHKKINKTISFGCDQNIQRKITDFYKPIIRI